MKKLFFIAVLAGTAIFGGVLAYSLWSVSTKSPQAYFESGKKFYDQGKFSEAVIELLNAVKKDPANRDSRYYLALSYMGEQNLISAVKELRAILEAHPDDIAANLRLGNIYLTGGPVTPDLYPKVKELAEHVLSKEPENIDGVFLLANASTGMKDFEKAVELYGRVIERDSKNVNAFIGLGTARSLQKDFARAEEAFLKARETNPTNRNALISLASYYRVSGNPAKAEPVLKEALSQYPADRSVYTEVVDFFQKQKRYDDVEKTLQAVQAASGSELRPTFDLADFYQNTNRPADARRLLLEAKSKFPENVQLSIKLAANLMSDKRDEARQEIDHILKVEPKNPAGHVLLGQLQFNSGQFDAAAETLGKEPALSSSFPIVHYLLGDLALQKGKTADAQNHYLESIKVNKAYIPARIGLVNVYMRNDNLADAREQVRQILDLEPGNAAGRLMRAAIEGARKNYSEAEAEFSDLVKQLPDDPEVRRQMGRYYSARNNNAEAEKNFSRALELSPNDEQTFRDVVVFYLKAKQPDRAMQKLNAVSDAEKQAFHYELMGMVAEQSGKPQDSVNAYKEALKKDPNRLKTETLLFNQYLHTGRFDDALQRLDVLEKKIPAGAVVPAMRGAIKEAQGHLKDAEDYYRQALQIDSTNDLAANNLAYLLAQEGRDLTAALGWAQGVRQRQPQDPSAADTLGWVFYKLDRLVQARDQLQFAVSMLPENGILQYHLGEIYKKNSQHAEAVKALKKAVTNPADFKEKSLAEASLKDLQKLAVVK